MNKRSIKSAIKVKIKMGNPNSSRPYRSATVVRDQNIVCIYDVQRKENEAKPKMVRTIEDDVMEEEGIHTRNREQENERVKKKQGKE